MISDASGNFFGVTFQGGKHPIKCLVDGSATNCGTVFKLSPPSGGKTQYQEKPIHFFHGADGFEPSTQRVAHKSGALYGATLSDSTDVKSCTMLTDLSVVLSSSWRRRRREAANGRKRCSTVSATSVMGSKVAMNRLAAWLSTARVRSSVRHLLAARPTALIALPVAGLCFASRRPPMAQQAGTRRFCTRSAAMAPTT